MDLNIIYTHELTINTTKIYEKGVLSIGGAINSEFERLDLDKNGTIDFEEFKNYVKEIIRQMLFTPINY